MALGCCVDQMSDSGCELGCGRDSVRGMVRARNAIYGRVRGTGVVNDEHSPRAEVRGALNPRRESRMCYGQDAPGADSMCFWVCVIVV